jgi:hypothetical protein
MVKLCCLASCFVILGTLTLLTGGALFKSISEEL